MGNVRREVRDELTTMGEFGRWLKPDARGMRWVAVGGLVGALCSAVSIAEGLGLGGRPGYTAAGAAGGGLLGARLAMHHDGGPWARRFVRLAAVALIAICLAAVIKSLLG